MDQLEFLGKAVVILGIGLGLGWLTKDMILERIMSRQTKRASWKKDKNNIQDAIANLLHTLEITGKVTPGGVDRYRGDMRKQGYKDLDLEPKFSEGKPFYAGPKPAPVVSKLKSQIKGRLGRGWAAALNMMKLRRSKPTQQKKDYFPHVSKFRKVS